MNLSIRRATWAAGLALALSGSAVQAAGFTYHGSLNDGGQPANGHYDLRLTPYGSEKAVAALAEAVTLYGVEVKDGRFNTEVDFGGVAANEGWIGVAVRKEGGGDFAELAGRSEINGGGECWSTTGNNAGAGDFIGTLNDNPLVMRVGSDDRFAGAFRHYDSGVSFEVGAATATASRAIAVNRGLVQGDGADSFAGGYSGWVGTPRSFVWGGTNRVERVGSSLADQFAVWADGGVVFNSSALSGFDDVNIYPRGGPGADADADLKLISTSGKIGKLFISNNTGVLQISATSGVHINTPVAIAESLKVDGPASKSTAGAWQANSDGRIKQDIAPVEDALDTLAKVRPVSFRYTDAYRAEHPQVADQRYYNVIAQQFAEVFPDAVTKSGEYLPGAEKSADNEILQVDTYPAQIVTIAAVQELAQKNAALEATVQKLMARLAKLEAKGK